MTRYTGSPDYDHSAPASLGLLLTNLGTPDAPTTGALRRYLGEFLRDPRVVETPRILWWPILHGVILRTRPRKSARLYQAIWTEEGSPLLTIGRRQAYWLQNILEERLGAGVRVALAMRYGQPSIAQALEALRAANVQRLLVLPLYPQYCAATTGSTFDAVADALRTWRWVPELRMVNHYHDDPGYIAALAASVRRHWEAAGRARRLLMSFHGIPEHYFLAGDPYHCQCHKTARLLAETLELEQDQWAVSFQSRFGPRRWLQPYTDKTLQQWARKGLDSVEVLCPGFSADCLETLEEIQVQNRELFLSAGGRRFSYIPALNDQSEHLEALANLSLRHCAGWPETDPARDREKERQQQETTAARARALGARR